MGNHTLPKPYMVCVEDRDGDRQWFRIVSRAPLADMCQSDLHTSLNDTLTLNEDDDITVVDILRAPTIHHA